MDLHPGETELFKGHPSWRSTLLFYIGGLALAAVAGLIAKLIEDDKLGVLVFCVVLGIMLLVGFLKRLGTLYVITNERLHIRRGIVARRTQETRVDRVQNVNTQQSVFQRILQVGTVDFDTAGTDDAEFAFRGVSQPEQVVAAVDKAQRTAQERLYVSNEPAAEQPPPGVAPPA